MSGNDVLSNKPPTHQTGKVDNYASSIKGDVATQADFNSMNPSNVRTYPNGTTVKDLADKRVTNMLPSSTLTRIPTVEIHNPIGRSIKIRY